MHGGEVMASDQNIPLNNMIDEWMKSQQKYWENISTLSDTPFNIPTLDMQNNDWLSTMSTWFAQSPTPPEGIASHLSEHIMNAGKHFLSMAQQCANHSNNKENITSTWVDLLEKGYNEWLHQAQKQQQSSLYNPFSASIDMAAPWMNMLTEQQKNNPFSAFSFDPSQMAGFTSEEWFTKLSASQQDWLATFSDMGTAPEAAMSSAQQQVMQQWASYNEAVQHYQQLFTDMGNQVVEQLKEHLNELSQTTNDNAKMQSATELFQLWVETHEEIYAQLAMTDHYQTAYSDLVNKMMELKQSLQKQAFDALKHSPFASQEELDEAYKRIQNLKLENRSLKQRLAEIEETLEQLNQATQQIIIDVNNNTVQTATPTPAAAQPKEKKASKPKKKVQTTQKDTAQKSSAQSTQKNTEQKNTEQKKTAQATQTKDNLTDIKGLGETMSKRLMEEGIQSFSQLAELSTEMAESLDKKIGGQGRLIRDQWVEQAKKLSQ